MIDPLVVAELIDRALAEDIGFADLTSELVIRSTRARSSRSTRARTCRRRDRRRSAGFPSPRTECRVELRVKDGDRIKAGTAMGGWRARLAACLRWSAPR